MTTKNLSFESLLESLTPIERDIIGIRLFHSPNAENVCDACELEYPCPHIRLADAYEFIAKDIERLNKLEALIKESTNGVAFEYRDGTICMWEPLDAQIPDGWCISRAASNIRDAIDESKDGS